MRTKWHFGRTFTLEISRVSVSTVVKRLRKLHQAHMGRQVQVMVLRKLIGRPYDDTERDFSTSQMTATTTKAVTGQILNEANKKCIRFSID